MLFGGIVGLGAWIVYGLGVTPGMAGADMAGMTSIEADEPRVPPVFGYYAGEDVLFIHTEASDPEIAQTLEGMMGSPVPVVPSLAEVPHDARSTVYVHVAGRRALIATLQRTGRGCGVGHCGQRRCRLDVAGGTREGREG